MTEQKPLASVTDGTGEFIHTTTSVFVHPGTGLELDFQVEKDGAYRTSVLTIGHSMRRLDIFGDRAEMERLHRLLGAHLEQLYGYLLERDGLAADVPPAAKERAMAALRQAPSDPVGTIAEAFASRQRYFVRHPLDKYEVYAGATGTTVASFDTYDEALSEMRALNAATVEPLGTEDAEAHRLAAEDAARVRDASEINLNDLATSTEEA